MKWYESQLQDPFRFFVFMFLCLKTNKILGSALLVLFDKMSVKVSERIKPIMIFMQASTPEYWKLSGFLLTFCLGILFLQATALCK